MKIFENLRSLLTCPGGGLPVDGLWTSSKPSSGTHLEIQPIQIGEAWVPERARYHYRTNPKSERIVTVHWIENVVNAPIAASVFDPNNLELVIGDPIVDLRTGIEQRFGIVESSVDHRDLADRWDYATSYSDAPNGHLGLTQVAVFVCPEDDSSMGAGDLSYGVSGGIGYSTYLNNVHDVPVDPFGNAIDLNGTTGLSDWQMIPWMVTPVIGRC